MAQYAYLFLSRAIFPKKITGNELQKNTVNFIERKDTNKSTIFMVYDNILLSTVEMTSTLWSNFAVKSFASRSCMATPEFLTFYRLFCGR